MRLGAYFHQGGNIICLLQDPQSLAHGWHVEGARCRGAAPAYGMLGVKKGLRKASHAYFQGDGEPVPTHVCGFTQGPQGWEWRGPGEGGGTVTRPPDSKGGRGLWLSHPSPAPHKETTQTHLPRSTTTAARLQDTKMKSTPLPPSPTLCPQHHPALGSLHGCCVWISRLGDPGGVHGES